MTKADELINLLGKVIEALEYATDSIEPLNKHRCDCPVCVVFPMVEQARFEIHEEEMNRVAFIQKAAWSASAVTDSDFLEEQRQATEKLRAMVDKRRWVELTDERRAEIMKKQKDFYGIYGWEWEACKAIEAELKELNNG